MIKYWKVAIIYHKYSHHNVDKDANVILRHDDALLHFELHCQVYLYNLVFKIANFIFSYSRLNDWFQQSPTVVDTSGSYVGVESV